LGTLAGSQVGRLEAAGFVVIEALYRSTDIPEESVAWRRVTSSLAKPNYTVPHGAGDGLRGLEANWRRIAIECGAVAADGRVLVSLTKLGSGGGGWTLVSLPQEPIDMSRLGPHSNEPEFVAMSTTGNLICGVTAEEYEMWIICTRLDS